MKTQLNEIKRMQKLAGMPISEMALPEKTLSEEDTSNVKYIVIDKQEGFSFIADGLDELIKAIGFDEYTNLDQIIEGNKGAYEIIEIKGEVKLQC